MGLIALRKQKLEELGYYEMLPRLIEARKRFGVLQKEVAEDLGVDTSTICRFESGARPSNIVFEYYMDRFGGEIE